MRHGKEMRLRERVLVAVVVIGVPILLGSLASGAGIKLGVAVGVFVAEAVLWQLHDDSLRDAESRAYQDGLQAGREEGKLEALRAFGDD